MKENKKLLESKFMNAAILVYVDTSVTLRRII